MLKSGWIIFSPKKKGKILMNPEKVWGITINNNNLSPQDLSCFARFVNLKHLLIGADDEKKLKQNIYNHFYGSLEYLGNLKDLEVLDISGTDIDNGLEHLPLASLEDFYCASKREGAKVEEIKRILMISENEAESEDKKAKDKLAEIERQNKILTGQLQLNN
ncbi:4662_t:CDS:2, partial [Paraglomus brasilianum]